MSCKHDVIVYDPEYDTWAPAGVEGYYFEYIDEEELYD